jgi:hypothetical protein
MAYYYNGARIVVPFTITSNEPTYHTDTISLKTQRSSYGHQRWELSFTTVLTEAEQVDGLVASILEAKTTGTMVMPQLANVVANKTISSDSVNVVTNASIGASSVILSGTSVVGKLPKGSFIKFSNHDKVYMVTSDCEFNNVSNQELNIYPNLRSDLTASAHSIKAGDLCTFIYYRDINDIQGITFIDGVLSNTGTVNLIEAV